MENAGYIYTPDNPDENGLKECAKLAENYENAYRVKFHIGTNAMKVTGDYKVVAEHQPQIIRSNLEKMEPILEQLKPIFADYSGKGKRIQICFVRKIESGEEWVRFQHNKTWWFLISSQADMTEAVISGMTLPIESHVLGNSRDYFSVISFILLIDTITEIGKVDSDFVHAIFEDGHALYPPEGMHLKDWYNN